MSKKKPNPNKLSPSPTSPIGTSPATALVEGEDYYINSDGNFVFTQAYHLKRGYCCNQGCQHCPYGFVKTKN